MTNDVVRSTSPFDAIRHEDGDGEYWMARELMPLLGYEQWRRFNDTINRAMTSMVNEGKDPRGHFSQVSQLVTTGNLGPQRKFDFHMTRYACYLTAMNGDTSKREIAAAQAYFVTKAREAEVAAQAPELPQDYLSALKALVVSVEAQQKAELEAAEAKAQAEELRPPAEAWEHLADTGQDYSVREAAYILLRDPAIAATELGPMKLFRWIVDNGMAQRKANGQYVPYSGHSERLRLKAQSRPDYDAEDPSTRKEANAQLRITVPGLSWIQQRMREQARPELLAAPSRRVMPEPEEPPIDFEKYRREAMLRRG